MRQLAVLSVLGGVLATPGRGHAAPAEKAHAVLEWKRDEGASSCMEGPALERAVEARLRRDVFVAESEADLVVRGEAITTEETYVVRLGLHTRDGRKLGSRELTTRALHCSALDDSLALVVAIMVDVPAEIARPPEPPSNGVSPILLPPRTHAPREPWRAMGALLGASSWGFVPGLTPGLRVRGGVDPPAFWWVEVDATYFADSEVEVDGGGASFSLLSAGLWLCPLELESESSRMLGCAGQTLSRLEASGFGFDENRSQTRLMFAVGVRGSVWWRAYAPVAVGVGVGADFPLVRDSFVLSRRPGGPEELFRPTFVAFTAEAGVGVEFR